MAHTLTATATELRLNLTNWLPACEQAGLQSATAIASALNVSTVQVWRVQSGQQVPGNRFIAGIVRVFGWERLPDLLIECAADRAAVA